MKLKCYIFAVIFKRLLLVSAQRYGGVCLFDLDFFCDTKTTLLAFHPARQTWPYKETTAVKAPRKLDLRTKT